MLTKDILKLNDKERQDLSQKISLINNFDINHIVLAHTVNDSLQTAIIELTNDLIEEYECNTTLEKSLCETIANSY
jgi:hypothetical protein